MTVLLTGATGYIGSAVLRRLVEQGHPVRALVRSEEKAEAVRAVGADAVVGDVFDQTLLGRLVRETDGVIHTAATGDSTSAELDRGVIETVSRESDGSEKPFVHTGGIWVFGEGDALTEDSPKRPETISGWRIPLEQAALDADVRTAIVAPGIVYGRGGGIAADFVAGDEVRLVGDGSQRWGLVHVDDLAALYVSVYEALVGNESTDYVFAATGEQSTMRELAEAGAHGRPIISETADESRARLGQAYADALLANQVIASTRARDVFGWVPTRPSLRDELASGGYARGGR
jgi:nucleoside-diphosphate-sugar epimerase